VSSAVIQSKLAVPPLGERLAARPRVSGLVAELLERHPLVLVTATAGAGKTTAVVQAAALSDRPTAWLTLDDTDAAPGRLLTYLEAALARHAPAAGDVATNALAARIPHAEAAGLLAEATTGVPMLLVVDGLERLAGHDAALAVIGALVRYAPPTLGIALLSRSDVGIDLGDRGAVGSVATVGEATLAFTPEEAAEALERAGREGVDPARAVADTGGWVTGVLFEAWRSADHVQGVGGEADPLHGYLATQILSRLTPDQRELLEVTSMLDEVTAERAEALGIAGAGELLVGLRARHLPVAWEQDRRCMRPHPRFREYLVERLGRRPATEVRALRRAHGELLVSEGHHEEAADELLRAGAPGEALAPAEQAIRRVVERLDFAVAERWLRELEPVAGTSDRLTSAELMLAISLEDFRRGARIADRLARAGERDRLARSSPLSGSMMAWCLWHLGRIDDASEVIAMTPSSPEADVVRYLLRLVHHDPDGEPEPPPQPSGGPLDALIMRVHYAHGRLPDVSHAPESSWVAAVDTPWRIGALRAMGRMEQALELYAATPPDTWSPAWTHGIVGAELMIDLGDLEQARRVLEQGRALIQETGSIVFEMLNRLIEAKLELRLAHDPAAALAILDALDREGDARRYDFIEEQLETWRGLALLLSSPDADAVEPLARAVESMQRSGRILELPTAAALLAEAHWRRGDEDAADRAADLALDAATRQGSNHHLLLALADFPAVVARRLDAEASADSSWHAIGRALMVGGVALDAGAATRIRVVELGRPAIEVDGSLVRPRIAKSVALLAYLAAAPGQEAERTVLLDALFGGRADESARSYLRQAVYRLREVLPEGVGPAFDGSTLRFGVPVSLTGDAARAESLLAEASRLQGEERLAVLLDALALLDRGEYLEGVDAPWVTERRERLVGLRADARLDAARLAFEAGRYAEAGELAEAALGDDPFRESAWRLRMQVAGIVGDEDGVIAAYRGCADALDTLGARPSDATRSLLERLRR
jgi:ATP/maltotriose-dependent transcriptional regulator MalT/DNA-binding SARP family transcriptional activator